jgi:hypothetical protein
MHFLFALKLKDPTRARLEGCIGTSVHIARVSEDSHLHRVISTTVHLSRVSEERSPERAPADIRRRQRFWVHGEPEEFNLIGNAPLMHTGVGCDRQPSLCSSPSNLALTRSMASICALGEDFGSGVLEDTGLVDSLSLCPSQSASFCKEVASSREHRNTVFPPFIEGWCRLR